VIIQYAEIIFCKCVALLFCMHSAVLEWSVLVN